MVVPIPSGSALLDALPRVDHSDVCSVPLPPGASTDPRFWVGALFAEPSRVLRLLLGRDRLVALRKAGAAAVGAGDEVVFGLDDLHLDFRIGVRVDPVDRVVTVGTVVQCHDGFGKVWFLAVRPVFGVVVRRVGASPSGEAPVAGVR